MTSHAPDPRLRPTSLAFVLSALLAGFMLYLAWFGGLHALDAARGFGVELAAPLDAFYLHVKADRDLAIGAVLVALLIYRRPTPLLLTVSALCIAPILDCALVAARGRLGYALAVHGSAAAFGFVLIALLARARRRTGDTSMVP
ncbi:MAG TPA: DUF4267 domain-containing protein [Kofleriaceae bacterium]|nr:DUF4267 domain-containing protein [Kofleriaceae bacterium]